jgi:hypothetical protein
VVARKDALLAGGVHGLVPALTSFVGRADAGAEGRSLKWAEVAAVPRVRSADGDVRLNLPDGRTVTFGFIGAGKALGIGTAAGARALDAKAIWRLIAMTRG